MPRVSAVLPAALFLLSVATTAAQGVEITGRRIPVSHYGFSIEIPRGWYAGRTPDGLPIFASVPWSRIENRTDLPVGAAIMHLVSSDTAIGRRKNLGPAEWARTDSAALDPAARAIRKLPVPPESQIDSAVISTGRARNQADELQRSVTIYWTFRGASFAVYLEFRGNDKKYRRYEKAMVHLAQSVRPD